MCLKTILFILSLWPVLVLKAQLFAEPAVLSHKEEVYTFSREKGEVTIKMKSTAGYKALKMGALVQVAEGYDDQSSIDKVNVKGLRGVEPRYLMPSSDQFFYSDARVCYIELPFTRAGESAQLVMEKSYKDPRYFAVIYFPEWVYILEKTVKLVVPPWMKLTLEERNFGEGITRKEETNEKTGDRIYTYTMRNLKSMKNEPDMPGRSHVYPHLLVLNQAAEVQGKKITYFETLRDLYRWYRHLVLAVETDTVLMASKMREIAGEYRTDKEKIAAIYEWVQKNIRYIAFEDGIAGFKPDAPQEVLKKKYGDCKGMANLLCGLLRAGGYDARLAWVGTNHIAYDYSTPSLVSDNHMICVLYYGDTTYFLDATVKYLPLGCFSENIQGREVMIEDGEDYLLKRIPVFPPSINTDSCYTEYILEGDCLKGCALQTYKGETKQMILSLFESIPLSRQEPVLKAFLEGGVVQDRVSGIKLSGTSPRDPVLEIAYNLDHKSGIQAHGKYYYIDLDKGKAFMDQQIDTAERAHDVELGMKHHIVRKALLHLPKGYRVTHIPDPLSVETDNYRFSVAYSHSGDVIIYEKELILFNTRIRKEQFAGWNADLERLRNSYLEHVICIRETD